MVRVLARVFDLQFQSKSLVKVLLASFAREHIVIAIKSWLKCEQFASKVRTNREHSWSDRAKIAINVRMFLGCTVHVSTLRKWHFVSQWCILDRKVKCRSFSKKNLNSCTLKELIRFIILKHTIKICRLALSVVKQSEAVSMAKNLISKKMPKHWYLGTFVVYERVQSEI